MGLAILVWLDDKDAHGWNGFGDLVLTAKGKVFLFIDASKHIQLFQPPFLFIVGIKPDMLVWVGWVEGLNERWWAWAKEILGRNKVGRRGIILGVGTKEGADCVMARDNGIITKEGGPVLFEIR